MSASGGGGGGGRKEPRNMQGLLKFCMETTATEDASDRVGSVAPMSAERKKFLQDVFGSLSGQDPVKVMLEDIKVILDEDEDVERKETAIEDLQLHCEDLDLANDFIKIGGCSLLNTLLTNGQSGYRWRAAELLGTIAQNNPCCQKATLEEDGLLKNVINILETDSDDTCRVKALLAISCMTREFSPGQEVFIKQYDGFSVLVRALQTRIEKVQIKASFMIAALCQENPSYRSTLVDMGLLEQLVSLLHQPHGSYHEHLMRALLILAEDSETAQTECKRSELGLQTFLEDRVKLVQNKEEYEEEFIYANDLLRLCFHGNSSSEIER